MAATAKRRSRTKKIDLRNVRFHDANDETTKSCFVGFRLRPDEFEAVTAAAEREGTSTTGIMRRALSSWFQSQQPARP